jgi:hypothetical protein
VAGTRAAATRSPAVRAWGEKDEVYIAHTRENDHEKHCNHRDDSRSLDAVVDDRRFRGGLPLACWRRVGTGGASTGASYDAKTVETVSGEVINVQEMTPFKGMGRGVHLMLETDSGTISVHLGPAWYIERQDTKIRRRYRRRSGRQRASSRVIVRVQDPDLIRFRVDDARDRKSWWSPRFTA